MLFLHRTLTVPENKEISVGNHACSAPKRPIAGHSRFFRWVAFVDHKRSDRFVRGLLCVLGGVVVEGVTAQIAGWASRTEFSDTALRHNTAETLLIFSRSPATASRFHRG